MSQLYFDQLLQKYLSGKCSKEEEVLVLEWYQQMIDKSKLNLSDEEKESIRNKVWSGMNIRDSIDQVPVKHLYRKRIQTIIYRAAIAASIIIAAFGWFWYSKSGGSDSTLSHNTNAPSNQNFFTNKTEAEQEIVLPDASLVRLQPEATIYYPKAFSGDLREVHLTGNAFFEVSHDTSKHFLVHTAGLVTEVLGTSFYIHEIKSSNKLEIEVVTGKVSVYKQDKRIRNVRNDLRARSVILTTNQKVTYDANNSQFITSLVEEPKPMSQYDQEENENFIFDDAPISKVLEIIRQTYGIEISADDKTIENCHFTGDITRQDLYKKLQIICQSLPSSSYEVRGVNIIIKGKGCD